MGNVDFNVMRTKAQTSKRWYGDMSHSIQSVSQCFDIWAGKLLLNAEHLFSDCDPGVAELANSHEILLAFSFCCVGRGGNVT